MGETTNDVVPRHPHAEARQASLVTEPGLRIHMELRDSANAGVRHKNKLPGVINGYAVSMRICLQELNRIVGESPVTIDQMNCNLSGPVI